MIGGTLEGQNQRTLELIEHLIQTGQLTLHGLLYLLHDTQSTTELAKIAELSSKRPLTIQTSLAERDAEVAREAFIAGVEWSYSLEAMVNRTMTNEDAAKQYANKIYPSGKDGEL